MTPDEDREWITGLVAALRDDIDRPLGRKTVERLWKQNLLDDREGELLLGVLLYDELTERQLTTVHSIKMRLLRRIKERHNV